MVRSGTSLTLAGLAVALASPAALAQASPWRPHLEAGYFHQFSADFDKGGDVSVDRAGVRAGVDYAFDPRTSAGFVLGYRFDSFDFGGAGELPGRALWSDVNELRLSIPLRYGVGEDIDVFVTPQLAWSAETGAGLGDAFTGGALAGATYRFSDRLRLGAGIGVFSQIEDDADVFPILLVDWQATDTLSVTTNPSIGFTRGPTLSANWRAADQWTFSLGFGREKLRFRTDTDDNVGEESAYPLFVAATYEPIRDVKGSLIAGANLGGEIRLEDRDGDLIASDDLDPAPFVGLALRARF